MASIRTGLTVLAVVAGMGIAPPVYADAASLRSADHQESGKSTGEPQDGTVAIPLASNRGIHVREEAPEVKATRDDLLGEYIYDEFRYASGHTGWDYIFCIPEIVAGEAADEVIINGFWADYDMSYNPPVPISRVKATFDYEKQTLTIPAGTSLGKYGDYPAYLYVSDWATDIMQPDPIVLQVDAATRCISYYCDRTDNDWNKPLNCLIVTSWGDAVGEYVNKGVDFIGAIVMNKYNDIMSVTNLTGESSGYCPIYVSAVAGGFEIANFGGTGYTTPLTFEVDPEQGTCEAPLTLWRSSYAVSETEVGDVYYASLTGDKIQGSASATGVEDEYAVSVPSWSLYYAEGSRCITEYSGCEFKVKIGKKEGDGISLIPTEANAGTIRYYDMMGRPVANPTSGELLIRVADGEATKVIMP